MPRKPLSEVQTRRVIDRLFDLYGVDRSPGRDRANDGGMYLEVIRRAARDGLLKVPDKKGASNRGAPSKWKGTLGIELLRAVENEQYLRKSSITNALKLLQRQHPQKWGANFRDLKKRYYEAKKYFD